MIGDAEAPLQGIRALIVEDEALIAEELKERLIRLAVTVQTADSADAAIERAVVDHPDVILMDIRLRGNRDGIDAVKEIHRHVRIPVVYLTAYSDRATVERAKETMPDGYILKPFREQDLRLAIEMAVHRHASEAATPGVDRAFDPESADRLLHARTCYERLTTRQREVFALVVQGKLNREIAVVLETTERTVKAHRAEVMRRMSARSVADLVRMAERLKL